VSDLAYFFAAAVVMIGLVGTLWNTVAESGGRYWAMAWVALFAGGGAAFVAAEFLAARLAYPFLGTLFVALLIAGTLSFCQQRLPPWLWPATLVVGLARSALQFHVTDAVMQLMGTVLMICGTAWCAWRFYHSDYAANRRIERLLSPMLALPGVAQAAYAWWRWQGVDPSNGLFTWLIIGMIVAVFQVVLLLGRGNERRSLEERRRAEGSFVLAQAEAARVLAGGFAHVMNNRLQPVLGYTDLLVAKGVLPGEGAELLDRIRDAAQRCTEVTKTAIDYSTPVELNPERITIHALFAPLTANQPDYFIFDDVCAASIEVDVLSCREALRQVVKNSIEAGATMVKVSTRIEGYHRLIVITDNGKGIHEDVRDRLFEPFSTTRMPTIGTGLGLALTRNVVVSHGGYVRTVPVKTGASIVLAFPAMVTSSARSGSDHGGAMRHHLV